VPDFQAKMLQIQFPMGLHARPRCGILQCSPRPIGTLSSVWLTGRDGNTETHIFDSTKPN